MIIVVGDSSSGRTYSRNVQIWSNRIHDNGSNGSSMYNHGLYYGATGGDGGSARNGTLGGVIANNVFYDQPTGYHLQLGPQADGVIVTNNTFTTATALGSHRQRHRDLGRGRPVPRRRTSSS